MDEMNESHNSLEDWIAFKKDIFVINDKTRKHRFLVAYNHIENSIAITCCEGTRRAADKRNKSMASSFTLQNLIDVNKELSLIRPKLDQYFQPIIELIQSRNSHSRLYSLIMSLGFG
ncbi:unnamed protein product, partial [Oppiella nova]